MSDGAVIWKRKVIHIQHTLDNQHFMDTSDTYFSITDSALSWKGLPENIFGTWLQGFAPIEPAEH